jgi:hypothetical protein
MGQLGDRRVGRRPRHRRNRRPARTRLAHTAAHEDTFLRVVAPVSYVLIAIRSQGALKFSTDDTYAIADAREVAV